jgi:SAM-dependent methyltransferase
VEISKTSGNRQLASSPYILDNAGKETVARFPALSALFDSGTIHHLENVGVRSGFACLEVGGGGGSIAAWLAERVAPTGNVLVTDIDPRFLETMNLPCAKVMRHDIARDPLPQAAFDLVHSRLVLGHVPGREQALAKMVAALKPGGWLVAEEFDSSLSPDPAVSPGEVLSKTHLAMTSIMEDHGSDRRFGRRLFGLLRSFGLVDVSAEGKTFMWSFGSPGPSLMRANYEQLRSAMIDDGRVTAQEFDEDIEELLSPAFWMPSPILWTVKGRRA